MMAIQFNNEKYFAERKMGIVSDHCRSLAGHVPPSYIG